MGELILVLNTFCTLSLLVMDSLYLVFSANVFFLFFFFFFSQSNFPELVLTEEERQLLEKDGVSLPTCLPLTKVSPHCSL